MPSNIAIIWDIENVTPPSSNSLFIDGLWDYAESIGRVVSARAYCDYSTPAFKKLGLMLKKYHFYLVHVPSEKNKKNSVDMQLTSDTLELLRLYDHIDHFLLVTGDSDFRPLLLTLRRTGKVTTIVCDIKTASQDLLALSDNFMDYRDLVPDEDDDQDPTPNAKTFSKEYWFTALSETASILIQENKSTNFGSLKIRMKMLNPDFNERTMGFKRWSDFVTAAVKKGYVQIMEEENQSMILPGKKEKGVLQKALLGLISALEEMDSGKNPDFHEYSLVSSKIKDMGIDLRSLGFRQFKRFIQAADVRGLVESKSDGLQHFVKRSRK